MNPAYDCLKVTALSAGISALLAVTLWCGTHLYADHHWAAGIKRIYGA